ncbi:hypothetical protein [Pilimelia anulata]
MVATAAQRVDGLAEGNACCVCPLCRAIAALRDPSPEFAERVAGGAADFAAGVTSLLRSLADAADAAGADAAGAGAAAGGAGSGGAGAARGGRGADDVWRAATRPDPESPAAAGPAGTDPAPAGADPAAAAGATDSPPAAAARGTANGSGAPARKPMAKKAVRKPIRRPSDPGPAA